jgi:hypothetical protein
MFASNHQMGQVQLFESYRAVNWKDLLERANHTINIVVYYWDKWVAEHQQSLEQFLRFFFADERIPKVLTEIERLFPGAYGHVPERIKGTYENLQLMLNEFQLPASKIEVYRLPYLLTYSMQCIDDKILVLSLFEMYRKKPVDSPAFVIHLDEAEHVRKFYKKELEEMMQI